MSLNYKRLYRWLPWLSAMVLAVVFVLFMCADLKVHEQVWHERLSWNTQTQKNELDDSARDLTQQAMLLAQLIGRDHAVLDRVRAAHKVFIAEDGTGGAEHLRAQRQALQAQLQDYWGGMEVLGGRYLSVYFAPGAVNFLRMHRPDRYGDSLSGLRPLLANAFSSGVPTWGIDVARQGSGYRALLPITANDNQTGGVIAVLEVGMSTLPQQADEQVASMQMAVFLRKAAVEQILWEQTRQQLNQQNPTTVDDWRLENTTDPQLHSWWKQGLVPINQQGQLVHTEGKTYIASWWPLQQWDLPLQESSLAMLVWTDITPVYKDYVSIRQRVIAKWLTALICAQLLLLVFIRLYRAYLRSLIEQHGEQMREEHAVSEQALQRLALALRSSDSGFWEWDIAHDKASFSPEWRQLCGIGAESPSSLDLDEWMSRVHPADKRTSYSDIIRHIKGETLMYENEYRLKIHDGSYKWILTRGKVVEWTAEGKAALMVGVYTDITERKNTELISIRQQAALHSLNEIASLSAVDPDDQLHRALSLGARYLGLSNGVISQINGEEYRVHVQFSAQGQHTAASVSPLSKTYCSLTLKRQEVVAEDDIPASQYRQHPAYLLSQIETYIGVPLWIGGEIYGTLSFNSRKSRHHQYDSLDRDFVRLLARWISSVVERWQQDTEKKIILQRFQKLSERLPGFLYQFQLRPDGSSFFPYASPGIKNIYDVSQEDAALSADKVFAVIHPEDAGWVGESVSYSAAHLTPWVATVRVNNPLRGMIWTHIESTPEKLDDGSVLWNGYVSDITALKQTEQQLKETNALRKAILDAASVAIISTDKDGTIKTFNHGAEMMLEYSADELIDKQTPALIHLPDEVTARAQQLTRELGYEVQPGFEAFIAKAREGGIDENEWHYVRKDGSQFPVLLTVSALRDAEGDVTGYLGIARDISEIKRIDQMKTEFISTVSHELRTPLTAISGALGILVNGFAGSLPESSARMIQIAHNNAQRLIYLVNDLLDMEKLVAGKMHFDLQPQLLLPLLQQAVEANAAFAQQYGVSYELIAPTHDVEVSVDHQRLLQVLANYLSNAAKFSPLNEVVTIHIESHFGYVRVVVADKGPGVPDEFRARLFQKFSQADSSDSRQKGGTGLGLAICKEIIERMGGSVGVNSVPGEGASFYFDLPCEDSTPKVPATRVEPQKIKPHVLGITNATESEKVMRSALPVQEYDVDCVMTEQSALEHLQLRDYDLIVLDWQLWSMSIVQHIRERESHQLKGKKKLPLIMVVDDIEQSKRDLVSLQEGDAIFWLQKPMISNQLNDLVVQILAEVALMSRGAVQ
ncbi:PAS domain S-box protein [Cellvibrio sp. OA-2007]|uniref:PAS domain S-box protein n=1 Tax=Cellvibrio sp. OA-2007 TaxID=529823 RepID=UPI000783D91C|nr:PAS domain S-box protein [Cellvibrio sp. OA-2007]